MDDIEYEFLADYFPKQEITLVHGTYGSGKSYTTIKALNEAGIKPYYINLDNTSGLTNLDYFNLNEKLLDVIDQIKEFGEDTIIIIDTYTVLEMVLAGKLGTELTPAAVYTFLDNFRILARNAAEVLWIEKSEYKATTKTPACVKYTLHVNKGRGTGGAKLVPNWMRG